MNKIFERKTSTIIILLATFILGGISIFTATRLYQLRGQPVAPNVPSSNPRAAVVPTTTPVPAGVCSLSFTVTLPTPTPTPTPTVTATPTATPVPQCNSVCTTNANCLTGMVCTAGRCRNPVCTSAANCICPTITPTPTVTATPTLKPTPTPTVTPTPTAPPTAVCLNVKAYSSNWSLLTSTQLANLTPGTVINLCVNGTTTGGSFDKARFTINGALQTETTAQRPGSTDFCQSYTIPTGSTMFSVSAQIHHTILGWL